MPRRTCIRTKTCKPNCPIRPIAADGRPIRTLTKPGRADGKLVSDQTPSSSPPLPENYGCSTRHLSRLPNYLAATRVVRRLEDQVPQMRQSALHRRSSYCSFSVSRSPSIARGDSIVRGDSGARGTEEADSTETCGSGGIVRRSVRASASRCARPFPGGQLSADAVIDQHLPITQISSTEEK